MALGLLLAGSPRLAQAQTTNTNASPFIFSVVPTNGSYMAMGTTNLVLVSIANAASYTNISVVGAFAGATNIPFLDDGRAPDQQATDGTFSGRIVTPAVAAPRPELLTLVIAGEEMPTDPPADPPPPPALATNEVEYIIMVPPPNDMFVNSWKLDSAGGLAISSNSFATLEPREPVHGGVTSANASVWWLWYPNVNTRVLVDLAGTAFDPVLAVYTGSAVSNLTLVASATNDVVNRLKPHVNFDAQVGKTYRIAVSSLVSNQWGDLRLRVLPGGLPDTNGPAVSISWPPVQYSVSSSNLQVLGTARERSEAESGVREVIVQVNNNTNLVIADGTTDWSAVVGLPPGTNLVRAYAIDYAGNRGIPASVVVKFLDPPNDLFAQAKALDPNGGLEFVNTQFAGKEPGEPYHAGNDGGRSIWYRWMAPLSGDLYLDTSGSDFDTLLAVYVGNAVGNLVTLASNDDAFPGSGYSAIQLKAVANQIYYIAVDGVGGAAGEAVLYHQFTTSATLYGLFVVTPLGGVVLPTETLFPPGATVYLWAIPDRNYEFVKWMTVGGELWDTENPLRLTMNQNYSLQADFRVKLYTDTFLSGSLAGVLPWVTQGSKSWSVSVVDGDAAAVSGAVADGQSSSLILSTNLYAGTGSFDLKVSSELGWDWLEFYVNGTRVNRWSGEVPWQNYRFVIPGGPTTLEWRYIKDNNFPGGADAAYLDNVYVTVERPSSSTTGPTLSIVKLDNDRMQLGVVGVPGTTYVIQVSPDLATWTGVLTNTPSVSAFQWMDPEALTARRFYRVLTP